MRRWVSLAFGFLFSSTIALAEIIPVEKVTPDKFYLGFDYDVDFPSNISIVWDHAFTDRDSVVSTLIMDPGDQTLILLANWGHQLGDLSLAPGLATTFGTTSWNGSIVKETKIFRDIGPVFGATYATPSLHAETFNAFLIPTQESYDTAVWLGISRFMGAVKFDEFGFGPRIELYYSKEGSRSFKIVEARVGATVFKHWEKTSLELFLGYNPVAADFYLGAPREASPMFRVSFLQQL